MSTTAQIVAFPARSGAAASPDWADRCAAELVDAIEVALPIRPAAAKAIAAALRFAREKGRSDAIDEAVFLFAESR